MGAVEDVRKAFQDLVAPELKSIAVEVRSEARESKLRDENLAAKIESADREAKVRDELTQSKLEMMKTQIDSSERLTHAKLEDLSANAQYASIMNALDLDKRVETLERSKQSASA